MEKIKNIIACVILSLPITLNATTTDEQDLITLLLVERASNLNDIPDCRPNEFTKEMQKVLFNSNKDIYSKIDNYRMSNAAAYCSLKLGAPLALSSYMTSVFLYSALSQESNKPNPVAYDEYDRNKSQLMTLISYAKLNANSASDEKSATEILELAKGLK